MSKLLYISNNNNKDNIKNKFNTIFNFIKYKKNNNKIYDFIFIDCNSIFIFPYIRYYNDINEILFKILSTILYIHKISPPSRTKIILSIDNGTSNLMKSELKYKNNRKSSSKKNIEMFRRTTTNEFNKLIGLIIDILSPLGIIVDVNKGEADFKIAYFIYKLVNINNYNILTISSDNDYIGMAEYSDILLKRKNYFISINKGDTLLSNLIPSELNIISPLQYYFYKALVGDRMDNINRLVSNKSAIKIINEFNRNITNVNEGLDYLNFINFVKEKIDAEALSKNLFMSIPFNENIFDTEEEKIALDLLLKNNILLNNNFDLYTFEDRVKYIKFGGKEYINSIINSVKSIYV